MNEQLQQFGRKILANADLFATGVLFVILVIMIVLFFHERSQVPDEPPNPPRRVLEERLPNEDFIKLETKYLKARTDIREDPLLRGLVDYNMFDLKSVKKQEEIERELDQRVEQAARLISDKKDEEALSILKAVLAQKPNHVRALDLKNRIAPEPTPTPVETPAPTPVVEILGP